ncbi:glycogen debranching protein GlgX [Schaalia sp. ZJ405]|uniref:glycogen debranching protein GlgX n=1 Tax=Schaalia sp. ZJ405 TaxID=2709403 RepID=UPI0013ECDD39|nr:glycogen debranching protein GlgX [Schaalia sp. ZJ405]QPK80601.1 glycogen debranching protein GlgX [Schaalia sp. ZJ405]
MPGVTASPSSFPFYQASPAPRPTMPLGIHVNNGGLDVAVVSTNATAVYFCILDDEGLSERRYALNGPVLGVWSGRVEGFGPGTRYGFRVDGPWDPDGGKFFNPNKFLIDPYARGIDGIVETVPHVFAHRVDEELYPTSYPLERSNLDSLGHVPASVVTVNSFPVSPKPEIPWDQTVIYELHVKGFTQNMPDVPCELRGTYAGLAHPASVSYLKNLGITAVELLPVHAKCDEMFLSERGLTNYWGYSTLGFFAPEPSYATRAARMRGAQAVVDEFRGMVSILHEAGIEVILDVVYNHTCESGDAGPSLSWRGMDSDLYYRHTPSRPTQMIDVTGTGNTVNVDQPYTIAMILDSLRYWISDMGIDGFRFDLAATLGRFASGYTPLHPLLVSMTTDPVISGAKLIAEPWDIGPGGWQTGNFPAPFSEWNDHYRGALRNFWLTEFRSLTESGYAPGPRELATRLAGSRDVFGNGARILRGPRASINFITAHDGFTLADLTTYNVKHNRANLEGNRDGSDDNRSWNHGVEGLLAMSPDNTWNTDTAVLSHASALELTRIRRRTQRNLLASMLISAGTPMITAGDEFSRTQYGNNNAYCQDSPISWLDWNLTEDQEDQISLIRWLISLRTHHPVLHPWRFATGHPAGEDTIVDLAWFSRSGEPLCPENWANPESRVFQMLRSGHPFDDQDLLVVFNATLEPTKVSLAQGHGHPWRLVFHSAWSSPLEGNIGLPGHDPRTLADCGVLYEPGATPLVDLQSVLIFFSDPA